MSTLPPLVATQNADDWHETLDTAPCEIRNGLLHDIACADPVPPADTATTAVVMIAFMLPMSALTTL